MSLPAAAGEPVKNALPEFAIPWRDARKRVPPLRSAQRAGEVAAGYKPAGRTGQRPVLHRNTDLQSVRPAEFHSAESAADRQLGL